MAQAPYDNLFIYEIKGDARPFAPGLGPAFLGLWLEEDTSFLFFSRPAEAEVSVLLAEGSGLRLLDRHNLTYQQWQGGRDLEPLDFPEMAIVPAWQGSEPRHRGLAKPVLWLDPGLVFGSGLHPTTRHCLELILLRLKRGPLGAVLDLGCGTGILGLAAALMGACPVLCVDLNPLCVQTTEKNARLNHLPVEVAEGPALDFLVRPADVVLANLHWQALAGLLAEPEPWAGKRDLILSGVTRSQVGPLEERLFALGYEILARRQADHIWFSLWACRVSDDGLLS
jgi:ribosomal protein L11 methyltransferase